MARKGGVDRGISSQVLANGKTVWYVRVYHKYRPRKFGGFRTKAEARTCYRQARLMIDSGVFRPESFYKRQHQHIPSGPCRNGHEIPRNHGVYFVQCTQTKHIKIGYSGNISQRITGLLTYIVGNGMTVSPI